MFNFLFPWVFWFGSHQLTILSRNTLQSICVQTIISMIMMWSQLYLWSFLLQPFRTDRDCYSTYNNNLWKLIVYIEFWGQLSYHLYSDSILQLMGHSSGDRLFPSSICDEFREAPLEWYPRRKFYYRVHLTSTYSNHQVRTDTEHISHDLEGFIFFYRYWGYRFERLDRIRYLLYVYLKQILPKNK